MNTIKVRPVLVKSESKSTPIGKYKDSGLLVYNDHVSDIDRGVPMDLILISLDPNEKIEVGDLFINEQLEGGIALWEHNGKVAPNSNPKKVIATQDQLSPELIKTLIEQHNAGGMEDFDIEMERRTYQSVDINYDKSGEPFNNYSPKLTNGFITVQPVINFKDASLEEIQRRFPPTYTEDEVRALVWESRIFFSQHKDTPFRHIRNYFNNWFEQNKKSKNLKIY